MHEFRGDPLDIFESITDAFFVLNNKWRFTYLNSEAERVLFRSREELLGKNVWEEFPETFNSTYYREYHRAVAEQVSVEFEEFYPPLGLWFEVKAYPSEAGLVVYFRDITGRKQAEKELEESEANYRALLEDLPELICRSLPDLTRTYVNEGYCRYFGKSRQELIGRSFLELLPEEDREPLKEHLASLTREDPVGTFEHRVWRHDGEVRWQQWTNRAIYDEQGRFVGYHAVGRDFNVRKLAEEALKESEEHFRSLADATFEGIVISEKGTILETNQAFAEMFGYQLSEVRGMSILEFHAPEFREQVRQRISSASEGSYESVGMRKDGTTFEVEIHERTAPHGDGGAVRVSAIRDISERKQAEDALRQSEERFRSTFENASTGVALVSLDRRYLRVNHALCEMLGYEEEELLGKISFEITHPADQKESTKRTRRLLSGESAAESLEKRYLRKDGQVVWVRSDVSAVQDEEGNLSHFVAQFQDITERRRAEEALRESKQRFRQLFDQSVDALFVHDENGRFVDCNSQACHLLGYSREELLSLSVRDISCNILCEEERAQKRREGGTLWDRAMTGEPGVFVVSQEEENQRKDGTTFPVEVRVGSVDYGGRRMILASTRDITERKQAEAKLEIQTAKLREQAQILDLAPVLIRDLDDKILLWNTGAEQMYGYSGEEALGRTTHELLQSAPPEPSEQIKAKILRQERWEGEITHTRKDGRRIVVASLQVLHRDELGEPVAVLEVNNDVTDRTLAQEALKEQQDFLRDVIDINPNLIFVKDRDGKFTLVNRAVADVYGTTVEELVGQSDADFASNEEEVEGFLRADREVIETLREKYIPEEAITDSRTGQVRWFQTTKVPLVSVNDESRRVLGVSTDITDRKVLEEQLRHQALHDSLTGLPNRVLFMDSLERALAGASRWRRKAVAVLFMDLDGFKVVNDSLGHEAGDQLLVAVSERMRECLRPADTAARFGGDEFAMLLAVVIGV